MEELIVALGILGIGIVAVVAASKWLARHRRANPPHKHMWEVVKVDNEYGTYEGKKLIHHNTLVYYRCMAHVPPATKTEWLTGKWTKEELQGDFLTQDP